MNKIIATGFLFTTLAFATSASNAFPNEAAFSAANGFTQSISINNSLSNPDISTPNLTESAIEVNYLVNGASCWMHTIAYEEEYLIHAGPTQGCKGKVNQVIVSVKPVNGNSLPTYGGNYTISIDTSQYATQIIVYQGQPPTFDPQSGLVKAPGSITSKQQSQIQ